MSKTSHHIPEITTNVKKSERTKQDISLPLPNQEHEIESYHHLHHHGMATCAASTRSSSRKTKKKYKQRQTSNSPHISDCLMLHCFTPRLMRTAAMKRDFTDVTENEQAGG